MGISVRFVQTPHHQSKNKAKGFVSNPPEMCVVAQKIDTRLLAANDRQIIRFAPSSVKPARRVGGFTAFR